MIRRNLRFLINIARSDNVSLKTTLVRATSGTFVLKIVALMLGLVSSVMLARLLGPVQYGTYNYAFSWLNVLSIPALIGLDTLLAREIAAYRAREEWSKLQGVIRFATVLSLLLSLVIAAIVFVVSLLILGGQQVEGTDRTALYTMWIALLLLPLNTITQIRGGTMKGLRQIIMGQVPDILLRPLLFIALLGSVAILLDIQMSAATAMTVRLVTGIIVFIYGLFILLRALRRTVEPAEPAYEWRLWLRSALPLLGIGLVNVAQRRLDILMLGPLSGLDDVGFYTVALTLSGSATLTLAAANQSLAPTFASLHATGDTHKLQRLVTRSTRLIALGSLPVILLLVLFGQPLLSIYGPAYRAAYPSLLILVIGNFISVAAGPVGLLLTMSGHEGHTLTGRLASVFLYFGLNLLLIPQWGMVGAAVATTLSIVCWNVILVMFAWRRLGIGTTVLGRLK